MAAPASSLSGAENHARLHRSICKNRCPQPIKTGKTEYLPRAETHTPPERWEFFTDDETAFPLPVRLTLSQQRCFVVNIVASTKLRCYSQSQESCKVRKARQNGGSCADVRNLIPGP